MERSSDITVTAGSLHVPGHLAVPAGRPPWPGVVILHEAFGLTDDIRDQARRLAAAGFLALAPDLYTGGPKLRCVLQAFRDLSQRGGRTFDAIEAAANWLAGHEGCTGRVGVIGFCLGGDFALLAAAREEFAAASVNYGRVPKDATEILAGACPIVASYGGRDKTIRGGASRLNQVLTDLDIPHDVKEYPAAGHGFLNAHRPSQPLRALLRVAGNGGLKEPEASDAWRRITAFFTMYLASDREGASPA